MTRGRVRVPSVPQTWKITTVLVIIIIRSFFRYFNNASYIRYFAQDILDFLDKRAMLLGRKSS